MYVRRVSDHWLTDRAMFVIFLLKVSLTVGVNIVLRTLGPARGGAGQGGTVLLPVLGPGQGGRVEGGDAGRARVVPLAVVLLQLLFLR